MLLISLILIPIFLVLGLDYILLKKANFSSQKAILGAIAAELCFLFFSSLIATGGAYLNFNANMNIILPLLIVCSAFIFIRITIAFYILRENTAPNTFSLKALFTAAALAYCLLIPLVFGE